MNTKIVFLIFFSLNVLFSCKSNQQIDDGIGYTEYINTQELDKSVVDKFPNGQERAVLYTEKNSIRAFPVKEVHYYENGKVQIEGTLKNKRRHGIWTFYHDNGKVWSTGEFRMGKSIGVFKIYNKEGQIKIKSYYKNNKKIKEDYFINGKLSKSVDLDKHKIN